MQEKENGEAKAEASDAKPATPAASPGAVVLEEGVSACFAVVSSAVRKGKGRGKGVAWAAGGYVPAHLRDPADEPERQPSPTEGGAADEGAVSPDAAAASAAPAATSTLGDASLGMAASFDSVGLSTSGSFDGEVGEGGSVRKRAKRWQRRASTSMVDLSAVAPAGDAGSAGGGATASASAGAKGLSPEEEEQSAKRPKVSPPPSPVVNDGGGDLPMGSPAPSGTASPVPPADPPADAGIPAGAPPPTAPDYGLPPPSPWPTGPATLDKLPASKLKLLARYHGVNITGCLEKAEMVAALRKAGLGDEAAEKMMERERGTAEPPQAEAPPDPRTELQKENERKAKEHAAKRQAAALAEAQDRAAAAEAEAKRLREELEASKTSSRKKWAPAFQSTPFIPEEEKRQDPMSLQRNPSFGFGNSRPPSFGAPMFRPEGGVDMRGKSQGKGAEFDICWEFKNNRCSKGKMCKWRHS